MRVIALLVLVACGGAAKEKTQTPAAPQAPEAPEADSAPMMFTVDQLRAGNPQGRVIELRMEAEGKPTVTQHWTFTKVDGETATIHSITKDASGNVIADETGTSKWTELHEHGKFPAAATTVEDNVEITVPAGTFKTRLYTVKRGDAIARFWFATEAPGPPVQFSTEQGGKIIQRAQMLRVR